jgi:hypothetical protein
VSVLSGSIVLPMVIPEPVVQVFRLYACHLHNCVIFSLHDRCMHEMQGKAAYIRSKVTGPFPRPYASGSYMHRAPFFIVACMSHACVTAPKPVAAGDGVVDDSLSPGKMVHTFVVYAALVILITFLTFSGIKNLASYCRGRGESGRYLIYLITVPSQGVCN